MEFIAHIREKDRKVQSLINHLEGVSSLTFESSKYISCPNVGMLLGLLHDFGKYSSIFQEYIRSANEFVELDTNIISSDVENIHGKIDHSTAGAQFAWNELLKNNNDPKIRIFAQFIALCIVSHHSGLIDCLSTDGEEVFIKRINKNPDQTYIEEVINNADKEIVLKIKSLISNKGAYDEFLSIVKNIIQSKNKSERIIKFQIGLLLKFLFSCLIDADRTDTADFENPNNKTIRQFGNYKNWDILIERFENKIKEFEQKSNKSPIDDIRSNISNKCKEKAENQQGIFALTVPTGGGKTLASLRFALYHAKKYNLDRIIYVIPYTSIIDQNAQVVREILEINDEEKGNIILEHHSNLLPEFENSKTKLLSENWDAPIIFTTTVQFLETVFGAGTRSIRRFHQMARSVIIFDEIQTLPIKTIHLFNNTINFLIENCKTTVVLCTATQPLLNMVDEQKGRLFFSKENEIIPNVEELFSNLKRVEVIDKTKNQGWSVDEIATLAIEQTGIIKSCLIVVNTKRNAINLYQRILKEINSKNVFHLSTSMCPAHRIKVLDRIKTLLKNNEQCICVSTQLIEAGVDVDFGCVIRYLAGIDSIAQAAGRCNRNGKHKIRKVYIVNPNEEIIDSLQEIKEGKLVTLRILNEMKNPENNLPNDFLHPKIMERYFQYYFYDRAHMMSYPINGERDDNLLDMLSENTLAVGEFIRKNKSAPNIFFRQSFKTAAEYFKSIDAPTVGIVVPFETEGKEIISELLSQFAYEKRFKILKRAQRYTVNVYPTLLDKLIKQSAISQVSDIGVYILSDERYYHHAFGLSEFPTEEYESLII
ncbi:MAG: CRISPR-associated endonuclease/helicase Cas3 [Epulopiscium sp.]|jgi:CRISPR-associated endonuclease/helicase Cas3|nr:CRISPR-associated endonuclease/helicase Cas3 [Eubacteriaceae bacterium]MDK2788574.1 CRISPR-associated endonuclease/helicase Cas3 [Candidatus Epulonipiscium sp.]